jgi:hypothetical protein
MKEAFGLYVILNQVLGLIILREVLGAERFDLAFHVERWAYKHPTQMIFQNNGKCSW